jgi:CheY-like chemotaxis protein
LVIEDEPDTARYICKGLVEGFSVVSSRDGAEGLRLATIENWDVVILDRLPPGNVDGLCILQTMRALHKATPFLVLSALASLDERVKGLRSPSGLFSQTISWSKIQLDSPERERPVGRSHSELLELLNSFSPDSGSARHLLSSHLATRRATVLLVITMVLRMI